jgi:SNF2 family DNA or RNA helicase
MIRIRVKDTGRMPSLAIGGALSTLDIRQIKAIGGVHRSRDYEEGRSDDTRYYGKPHYELPLPLIKRLFVSNGTTNIPSFMIHWQDYVMPSSLGVRNRTSGSAEGTSAHLDDSDTQANRDLMLRLRNFYIEEDAVTLYKKWEMFEGKLKLLKENNEELIDSILSYNKIQDSFFARPPKIHQKAGIAFFLLCNFYGVNHILLFDEMRTGKTLQAINIARILIEQQKIDGCLIVVPNTIKRIWEGELLLDAPVQGCFSLIIEGAKTDKAALWRQRAFFHIVNYESARADIDYMLAYDKYMNLGKGYMLIGDEAHKIKNPKSLQAKAILKLHPKYSIFMTGTPVANRPEDAFTMADFVSPGILGGNIFEFTENFCVRGGDSGKEIIRYENLDEVKHRLARISMRRLRKDTMFDKKTRETRKGTLEGSQKQYYEQMRDQLFVELLTDTNITAIKARNKLVQTLRLSQICDGYLSDNPSNNHWLKENWKFKEIDEFLDEYLDDIGKVVLWTRFVPVVKTLYNRYQKYGATYICGEVKDTQHNPARTNAMYKFQQNPDCRVMVAQINSAGLGLGFQPATFAIFLDKWWSPAPNGQAEDRILGIKNPVPVTIISLVTEGCIDERWEYILERKKSWANLITGDEDGEIAEIDQDTDKDTLLYLLSPEKETETYKKRLEDKWN